MRAIPTSSTRSMVKLAAIALSLVIAALMLAGCGSLDTTSQTHQASARSSDTSTYAPAMRALPASVKQGDTLTFATDATYAPFESVDQASDKIVGIDADLASALSSELGVNVRLAQLGFDSIIPALQSGKFSGSISAISITPARAKAVSFVEYFRVGSGVLVAVGNPQKLAMTSTALCGKSIGAPIGTIQAISELPALSKQCVAAGKRAISISTFPDQQEVNLAVGSGRIDGALASAVALSIQAKASHGKLELAPGAQYKPTPVGIALPKGSRLLAALKIAVRHLGETGQLAAIARRWGFPKSAAAYER